MRQAAQQVQIATGPAPTWENGEVPEPVGIYVSIPFCKAKCTFCNFASEAFPPSRMQAYVERLADEVAGVPGQLAELGVELPRTADSIYFGGGTPSLLSPDQFSQLMSALREQFAVADGAEITMEAAPGQIGEALLESALLAGVNRVSLGVQSFVDREARAVGRLHGGALCLEEIERLRCAGVPRLSLDLIAGLPHQTAESWAESLRLAVDSGVEHISVYMLETDGDSRLGTEVERLRSVSQLAVLGQEARYQAAYVPPEELCADLYAQACATLEAHGFPQYEISNFAQPGGQSQHNRKYWDRRPYLGFGLDAHSMLEREDHAVRFQNPDVLDDYMEASAPREVTRVDRLAAFEESVFLGLRRREGIAVASLTAFQQPLLLAGLLERARELAIDGLLQCGPERIQLTAKGRVLSSAIFGELLTAKA